MIPWGHIFSLPFGFQFADMAGARPRRTRRARRPAARPRRLRRRAARPRRGPRQGLLSIMRRTEMVVMRNGQAGDALVVIAYPAGVSSTNQIVDGTPTGDGLNGYNVPFAFRFALNQLINSSDLTSIADRYMINKVWIRMFYSTSTFNTSTAANAPSQQTPPIVKYYYDYDEAAAPTVSEVDERMGTRTRTFGANRYVQVSVKPKYLLDAVSNGNRPTRGFLDCGDPDIYHYGVKGYIGGLPLYDADTAQVFVGVKFDIVFHVLLKDVR